MDKIVSDEDRRYLQDTARGVIDTQPEGEGPRLRLWQEGYLIYDGETKRFELTDKGREAIRVIG